MTGGGSALGRGLVRALLDAGQRVCIFDLHQPEWLEENEDCLFYSGDVRIERELQRALQLVVDSWGAVDAAFNLAELCPAPGRLEDVEGEEWRDCLDTNLKGTWLCLKCEIPRMKESRASIVNLSSMLASGDSSECLASYISSKQAILELTRSASREATWIRVNAVCPGPGTAVDQVVSTALWLASPQASGVNGQAIEVGEDSRRV